MQVVGWLLWTFVAFLALSFAYGVRAYTRAGLPFQMATAVATLVWWALAVAFLLGGWNKLHLLWAIPASFFGAQLLARCRVPVVSRIVVPLTRIFVSILTIGVRPRNIFEEQYDREGLREGVIERAETGEPRARIAREFGITRKEVERIVNWGIHYEEAERLAGALLWYELNETAGEATQPSEDGLLRVAREFGITRKEVERLVNSAIHCEEAERLAGTLCGTNSTKLRGKEHSPLTTTSLP